MIGAEPGLPYNRVLLSSLLAGDIGEADLAPYITPIVQAKPDMLYMATGGSGNVNFMKLAKAMAQ